MAKHIRLIAESIFEAETRAMVMRIAEDYERMGHNAGEPIETRREDERG